MRLKVLAILLSSLALSATAAAAEKIRAVTEDGRKVVLTPDGKWYFDSAASVALKGPVGESFQPVVKKFRFDDPGADWTLLPKRELDGVHKRTFQHKRFPMYALVISEELPLTTVGMKDLIVFNMQNAGSTVNILVDDLVKVSGRDVGLLKFTASNKGLEFMFSTLYYGDEDGGIQVACYTGQAVFHKYQDACREFQQRFSIN